MRKILSALLVLATAGLIVTGAILPKIVSAFHDEGIGNSVQYAPMQSIRLDLGEDLSVTGKLVLMHSAEALDISESQASKSREEIENITWEVLTRYQDAGLVAHFDPDYIQVRPTMCVDPQDPGFYTIAWAVIVGTLEPPDNLVMMTMDDATGAVLSISYDTGQNWFTEAEESAHAAVLCDLFFSGLRLNPERIGGTDSGYDLSCLLYDEAHGYVNINFYVFSSGFYIEFT